jgi:hypothetical protein
MLSQTKIGLLKKRYGECLSMCGATPNDMSCQMWRKFTSSLVQGRDLNLSRQSRQVISPFCQSPTPCVDFRNGIFPHSPMCARIVPTTLTSLSLLRANRLDVILRYIENPGHFISSANTPSLPRLSPFIWCSPTFHSRRTRFCSALQIDWTCMLFAVLYFFPCSPFRYCRRKRSIPKLRHLALGQ